MNYTENIDQVQIDKLTPFPNHPFTVKEDESLLDMIESIKERGVITPIIVRAKGNDEYEIISGHRRVYACEKAGISVIPAIIKNYDDEMATIVMADSNLTQRENISPTEKGSAYRMKLDALKIIAGRGKRNDIKGVSENQIVLDEMQETKELENKLKGKSARDFLSEESNESSTQIQRYIRLTELVPELKNMVDKGEMGITSAVELSYLTENEQNLLVETIDSEQCTPSLSQAQKMHQMSKEKTLNEDSMLNLMMRPKKSNDMDIIIKYSEYSKYFPKSYSPAKVKEGMLKLVEMYFTKQLVKVSNKINEQSK